MGEGELMGDAEEIQDEEEEEEAEGVEGESEVRMEYDKHDEEGTKCEKEPPTHN